jgi:transcriptional regulator with GAF, ATPase, and Fis domain
MIGRSGVMQELFDAVRRLAPHVRTVLISGETGTGKELVARAFHKIGPRRDRRFSTVNCSAVVDTLFESELFGHQRGAFTGATDTKVGVFEHVDGGTLFLDEVGELPATVQPKLLRAVEYGEIQRVGSLDSKHVDVRVIAVALVPLRERREDIPLLVAAFVRECAARLNRSLTGVTTAAERALQEAPWPGNIRELRNVIERACLLSEGRILGDREVQAAMTASSRTTRPERETTTHRAAGLEPPSSELIAHSESGDDRLLASAQRAQIDRVLKLSRGNKTEAARMLGISRRSLYRWIDRLALEQVRRHA